MMFMCLTPLLFICLSLWFISLLVLSSNSSLGHNHIYIPAHKSYFACLFSSITKFSSCLNYFFFYHVLIHGFFLGVGWVRHEELRALRVQVVLNNYEICWNEWSDYEMARRKEVCYISHCVDTRKDWCLQDSSVILSWLRNRLCIGWILTDFLCTL